MAWGQVPEMGRQHSAGTSSAENTTAERISVVPWMRIAASAHTSARHVPGNY